MYAVLGSLIEFDVLTSPTNFESEQPFEYAVHKVVEARPLLQWIGTGLRELELTVRFHSTFTNPATQLQLLQTAAEAHQAMAFVYGNGRHLGYFVITSLGVTDEHMADDGSPISITVKLKLQEWALGSELSPTKPPKPSFTPLALSTPQESAVSIGVAGTFGTLPASPFLSPDFSSPGTSAVAGTIAPVGPSAPGDYKNVPPQQIVGAP
jgi:phage protein U